MSARDLLVRFGHPSKSEPPSYVTVPHRCIWRLGFLEATEELRDTEQVLAASRELLSNEKERAGDQYRQRAGDRSLWERAMNSILSAANMDEVRQVARNMATHFSFPLEDPPSLIRELDYMKRENDILLKATSRWRSEALGRKNFVEKLVTFLRETQSARRRYTAAFKRARRQYQVVDALRQETLELLDQARGELAQLKRRTFYLCEVCWSASWDPCPPGTPNAVKDPGREGEWMVCASCAMHDGLVKWKRNTDMLARAIADAAQEAGIYNGEVALSGAELLLLLEDMAKELKTRREMNPL